MPWQDTPPRRTLLSKGLAAGLRMSLLESPGTETELEEPEMKGEILDQIQWILDAVQKLQRLDVTQ